ncbi:MAG: 4-hydroxy-2-oxovalerate aldolase [Lachnospiraceae bacterium]|nr:4-hydroxy-2-oxovalerate aldolase [Lachnospiraceae bacterium]
MKNSNNQLKIMDVTLRDGSYVNRFQFSCAEQKVITTALEDVGYEYIEIGHGMGLGASSPQNGIALHCDKEYLGTAQKSLKNAKYGMFCIPGIASLEDIDMAADYGVSFLRIGTNVDSVESSKAYIERAKKHGIYVMTNYMKSYAVSPTFFAEQVKKSEKYGADIVYVVDSAGSMMPEEIEIIYNEVRKVSSIGMGFHGHDNLGLAMANSIKAADLGFEYIDCSLQGMGRSSGNTSTELFTICARKRGYNLNINIMKLLEISKKYVYPIMKRIDPIDVMCGVTGFHTSYLGAIHKVAGTYGVNPLVLMEEYTKDDKLNMNIKKLEDIAKRLPEDIESLAVADFSRYFGDEQS